MIRNLRLLFLFLCVSAGATFAAAPVLTLSTPKQTLTFSAQDFAALPHVMITLPAQDDEPERHFSGVSMRELLTRAGAPLGEKMRKTAMMLGVIIHCKDGYSVLYALAEFDESFSNRTILLADREDGAPLPPSESPLRIVAPGDKRGARSCKQVVAIDVASFAKP